MNVTADADGLAELRRLGAGSVPVVSKGERFVYAQVIRDVAEFLDLGGAQGPELPPDALVARGRLVLETALRLAAQMPDARLDDELPDRPRSWRVLMHHVFQIPTSFLEAEEHGGPLRYEVMVAEPPDTLRRSADIVRFGEGVARRFAQWWERVREEPFDVTAAAYFGETTRHELLERTVWHMAQHVRQLASLLERAGIAPDRPLGPEALQGLPLSKAIWDEPSSGKQA